MVEGFAPMKYFGSISRSFSHFKEIFLLFFFQPRPDFKTSSFSKPSSWGGDFSLLYFFPPQMIGHKRRDKGIILHHPHRRDLGLGWIGKATQNRWVMMWSHHIKIHSTDLSYRILNIPVFIFLSVGGEDPIWACTTIKELRRKRVGKMTVIAMREVCSKPTPKIKRYKLPVTL